MSRADTGTRAGMDALLAALRPRLADGDLSCELCDRGLARAAAPPWRVQLGAAGFAGPARTVAAGAGDLGAVRAAAGALSPGEVLVVSAPAARGAVFGETLARLAQGRSAAGVVVDGWVRDLPPLARLGLPLVARDAMPARAQGTGGQAQVRLELGGLSVAPGDLVVVDANGLVAVAAAQFGALERALARWDVGRRPA